MKLSVPILSILTNKSAKAKERFFQSHFSLTQLLIHVQGIVIVTIATSTPAVFWMSSI